MALVKITFDSASVTAKQDADLNHFMACFQNGKIPNVLGGLTSSTSNNNISFTSGYVQVYGRRVYVENGSKVTVSLDGTAYGYVIIKFNIDNNAVSLEKKEYGSSYPSLTQEDLMNGGSVYELPIARYTKTSSSLSLDTSFSVPTINNAQAIANNTQTACNTRMDTKYGSLYQGSGSLSYGKTYIFRSITTANASDGIGSVYVGGTNVLFNTNAVSGSGGVVHYYYSNQERSLSMQLTSSGLYIEASDSSIPKYVRIVK